MTTMSSRDSAQNAFLPDLQRKFLQRAVHEAGVIEIFKKFRAAGFEPILIKGWSIERYYPIEIERVTTDVDLCVHPHDYKRAKKFVEQTAFGKLQVDLHNGLRHLDKLPFEDSFAHSQLVETAGTTVRVLRHEDNLRVTCVHWLNDGGAKPEKLWDIFYLVQNRPADFDWSRCLDQTGEKRRRWLVCAIALAHARLGLDVAETPIAKEIENGAIFPRWFLPALEKEWNDPIKLGLLSQSFGDWKTLRQQLRKRFPPNAIQASIEVEAPFDNTPRLPYQIADIFYRVYTSAKRSLTAPRQS